MFPERQRGFSVVAAIFLLVVLTLLAAFIASVTGMQQSSSQLDVLGVRAYHAARAGLEWGAHKTLDPGNSLACNALPACPTSPEQLTALPGALQPFTVTVTCQRTDTTEGNRLVAVYSIVATACNQPSGGACPNPAPSTDYVERQVQGSVSKCKDPTAAPPRCACG